MDHLKRNKLRYGTITFVTTGTCSVYYYNHLEYTPFTNRRRFMLFTNDQLEIFEKLEKESVGIRFLLMLFLFILFNNFYISAF
jgi:hypothetical protein